VCYSLCCIVSDCLVVLRAFDSRVHLHVLRYVSCSVLQCVAVCCSVLQCVAVCLDVLQCALHSE